MKKNKAKHKKSSLSRRALYNLYMRTRMLATCSMENINYNRPALAASQIVSLTHDADGDPASLEQVATVSMALHSPFSSKLMTFDEFLVDLATITTYTPPAVVEASVNAAVAAISGPAEGYADLEEAEEEAEEATDSEDLEEAEGETEEEEAEEETEEEEAEEEAEEEDHDKIVTPTPPKLEIPADAMRKKKKKKNKKHKKNS